MHEGKNGWTRRDLINPVARSLERLFFKAVGYSSSNKSLHGSLEYKNNKITLALIAVGWRDQALGSSELCLFHSFVQLPTLCGLEQ